MKIILSSDNLIIDGKVCGGFPLIVSEQDGLILPLNDYLSMRWMQHNVAVGTLVDEAYILRDWWKWVVLDTNRHRVIGRKFLQNWRNARSSTGGLTSRIPNRARIQRSLDVIQGFHKYCATTMQKSEWFRSSVQFKLFSNFYERLDIHFPRDEYDKVRYATIPDRVGVGRPTPDNEGAEAVLEQLGEAPNHAIAERNHLMARWMVEAGLRRAGVASLDMSSLSDGLRDEGIFFATSLRQASAEEKLRTHRGLYSLRTQSKTAIFINVTEKGSKTRKVKVPLDLVEATLDYIWTSRNTSKLNAKKNDALWLSRKTGDRLGSKAIGDLIKTAFNSAQVLGSGHRLRAKYAQDVVYDLYIADLARLGDRLDENSILLHAAELMGHADWKSLRYYLNNAKRMYVECAEVSRN